MCFAECNSCSAVLVPAWSCCSTVQPQHSAVEPAVRLRHLEMPISLLLCCLELRSVCIILQLDGLSCGAILGSSGQEGQLQRVH